MARRRRRRPATTSRASRAGATPARERERERQRGGREEGGKDKRRRKKKKKEGGEEEESGQAAAASKGCAVCLLPPVFTRTVPACGARRAARRRTAGRGEGGRQVRRFPASASRPRGPRKEERKGKMKEERIGKRAKRVYVDGVCVCARRGAMNSTVATCEGLPGRERGREIQEGGTQKSTCQE